jgi:HD-like signal output (HDOD) protein
MKLATSVVEELWFDNADDGESDVKAKGSMAATVATVQGLKPFPLVARKVISLMSNPNYKVSEITKVIEEDPSLASNVLRVANSALFSGLSQSKTVSQAVVRLGSRSLQELVVSITVAGLFKDVHGIGKTIRDHCAGTAAIVRTLARDVAAEALEGAFLSGLMHDLGKLLLMQTREIQYEKLFDFKGPPMPDQIHLKERAALGFDHAVLAGQVLSSWHVPDPVPKVVAWHHQPTRAYNDRQIGRIVALLRIADQIDSEVKANPESFDTKVYELCKGIDCQYLGISPEKLIDLWQLFYNNRNEVIGLFN